MIEFLKIILKSIGTFIVSGVKYIGRIISIDEKTTKIIVDNKVVGHTSGLSIKVEVVGDVDRIETQTGDVDVTGSSGDIKTMSGDVKVGSSALNINTMSGDVTVKGNATGSIKTMSGDVNVR